MGFNKWPNLWNNWKEVQDNLGGEPGPGPIPGDYATKQYVDDQDRVLSDRITTNTNNINLKQEKLEPETQSGDLTDAHTLSDVNLTTKKNNRWTLLKVWNYILDKFKTNTIVTTLSLSSTNDKVPGAETTFYELEKKVNKRSTGNEVYYHSDATQGGLTVKTAVSSTPSDSNILTEKAIATLNKYTLSGGKIKLAGGLEIVYGSATVGASATETKNFSSAFTNSCLCMISCPGQPGYGASAVLHTRPSNKSSYTVSQAGGVANMYYYYIAIGY